jgi:gluconokinase
MVSADRFLIVIMGVSGCGKSTVGQVLAKGSGWPFLEGDDFHPAQNIQKMSSGIALTDQDRAAWVERVCEAVNAATDPVLVLACSALTPFVRNGLNHVNRITLYVHLKTDRVDMADRLNQRDHFMPVHLLPSQYAALSLPDDVYEFVARTAPDALSAQITEHLTDRLTTALPS